MLAIVSLVIAILALVFAILPIAYFYFKDWATKSLLRDLKLKALDCPISDGSETYWTISLMAGKGNWACKILNKRISLNLACNVLFEPRDETSGRFNSHAYDIAFGIENQRKIFPLKPNTEVRLVVAQRSPDLLLRTLGDSFGFSELNGSYDLVMFFKDDTGQEIREPLRIESYIKNGNPNV